MFNRVFIKEPDAPKESEFTRKHYDPYEQDLYHFPDCNLVKLEIIIIFIKSIQGLGREL